MTIVLYIILILFIVLLIRLGWIQIFHGTAYIERAYDLWTREITVNARRGNIYDRNGKLIVGNTLSPTISIIPKQVKDKEYCALKIAQVLNISAKSILYHFNKNVSVETIKPEGKNITLEQAQKIIQLNLDGVYVSSDVVRY